jgi:hypothetical protein
VPFLSYVSSIGSNSQLPFCVGRNGQTFEIVNRDYMAHVENILISYFYKPDTIFYLFFNPAQNMPPLSSVKPNLSILSPCSSSNNRKFFLFAFDS